VEVGHDIHHEVIKRSTFLLGINQGIKTNSEGPILTDQHTSQILSRHGYVLSFELR